MFSLSDLLSQNTSTLIKHLAAVYEGIREQKTNDSFVGGGREDVLTVPGGSDKDWKLSKADVSKLLNDMGPLINQTNKTSDT